MNLDKLVEYLKNHDVEVTDDNYVCSKDFSAKILGVSCQVRGVKYNNVKNVDGVYFINIKDCYNLLKKNRSEYCNKIASSINHPNENIININEKIFEYDGFVFTCFFIETLGKWNIWIKANEVAKFINFSHYSRTIRKCIKPCNVLIYTDLVNLLIDEPEKNNYIEASTMFINIYGLLDFIELSKKKFVLNIKNWILDSVMPIIDPLYIRVKKTPKNQIRVRISETKLSASISKNIDIAQDPNQLILEKIDFKKILDKLRTTAQIHKDILQFTNLQYNPQKDVTKVLLKKLINDNINIHIINDRTHNILWFCSKTIAKFLEYAQPNQAIKNNITKNNKCTLFNLFKYDFAALNDVKLKTCGKNIYINEDGIEEFILRSRALKSYVIAKESGVKIHNKISFKEIDIVQELVMFCEHSNINYSYQYRQNINRYSIDFFIHLYNISVEIDENGHKDRDPTYEISRENFIVDRLGCEFIRVNPDSLDFHIGDLIGKINSCVLKKMSTFI